MSSGSVSGHPAQSLPGLNLRRRVVAQWFWQTQIHQSSGARQLRLHCCGTSDCAEGSHLVGFIMTAGDLKGHNKDMYYTVYWQLLVFGDLFLKPPGCQLPESRLSWSHRKLSQKRILSLKKESVSHHIQPIQLSNHPTHQHTDRIPTLYLVDRWT